MDAQLDGATDDIDALSWSQPGTTTQQAQLASDTAEPSNAEVAYHKHPGSKSKPSQSSVLSDSNGVATVRIWHHHPGTYSVYASVVNKDGQKVDSVEVRWVVLGLHTGCWCAPCSCACCSNYNYHSLYAVMSSGDTAYAAAASSYIGCHSYSLACIGPMPQQKCVEKRTQKHCNASLHYRWVDDDSSYGDSDSPYGKSEGPSYKTHSGHDNYYPSDHSAPAYKQHPKGPSYGSKDSKGPYYKQGDEGYKRDGGKKSEGPYKNHGRPDDYTTKKHDKDQYKKEHEDTYKHAK
jgi:hypothetical protein